MIDGPRFANFAGTGRCSLENRCAECLWKTHEYRPRRIDSCAPNRVVCGGVTHLRTTIEYEAVVDDPKMLTGSWTTPKVSLKRAPDGTRIAEAMCFDTTTY